MEFLLVVLLIVIIYLLVTHKSSYDSKMEHLEVRILDLQRLLKQSLESRPTNLENFKPEPKSPPKTTLPLPKPETTEPLSRPAQPTPVEQYKEVITGPSAESIPPAKPSLSRLYIKHPSHNYPFLNATPI
jgi:hypothetical protein